MVESSGRTDPWCPDWKFQPCLLPKANNGWMGSKVSFSIRVSSLTAWLSAQLKNLKTPLGAFGTANHRIVFPNNALRSRPSPRILGLSLQERIYIMSAQELPPIPPNIASLWVPFENSKSLVSNHDSIHRTGPPVWKIWFLGSEIVHW